MSSVMTHQRALVATSSPLLQPPGLVRARIVLYITPRRSLRKSQNQTVRQHLDSFAEIWILAPQAKILTFQIVVLLIFATGNSISAPYNPQKFPPAAQSLPHNALTI